MSCNNTATSVPSCGIDENGVEVQLVAHYIFGKRPDGNYGYLKTVYSKSDGVTAVDISSFQSVSSGQCQVRPPVVDSELLCDAQTDDEGGVSIVEFYRVLITVFDADGNPSLTSKDYTLDYSAEYTPTGIVGPCNDCDSQDVVGLVAEW